MLTTYITATAFEKFIQSVSYLAWQSGVFSARHPPIICQHHMADTLPSIPDPRLRLMNITFGAFSLQYRSSLGSHVGRGLEISRILTRGPNYQFWERVDECVFARQKNPAHSPLFCSLSESAILVISLLTPWPFKTNKKIPSIFLFLLIFHVKSENISIMLIGQFSGKKRWKWEILRVGIKKITLEVEARLLKEL